MTQGWERAYYSTPGNIAVVLEADPGRYTILNDNLASLRLFQVDLDGNVLWSRQYPQTLTQQAWDLVRTADGGYALLSALKDGNYHISVMKVDSVGNPLWEKEFDWAYDSNMPHRIAVHPDGGFVVSGQLYYGLSSFIMKLDANGDSLWVNDTEDFFWHHVFCRPDGKIDFIAESSVSSMPKVQIGTLAADGVLLDIQPVDLSGLRPDSVFFYYRMADVTRTADGNYVIGGSMRKSTNYAGGPCAVKVSAIGATLWSRLYAIPGPDENMRGVNQIPGGGYVFSGYQGQPAIAAFMLRADEQGNLLWKHYYGTEELDGFLDATATSDGGFLACGTTRGFSNPPSWRTYLVKTNSAGISLSNAIRGTVFRDANADCMWQPGETPFARRLVRSDPEGRYATTDANGYYLLDTDSLDHVVSAVVPNHLWNAVCPNPPSRNVSFNAIYDTSYTNDFGLEITEYCPLLEISVGCGALRRCFNNMIPFRYCNNGTDTAWNVWIRADFSTGLIAVLSTVPWDTVKSAGNTYYFFLDWLPPDSCGYFHVTSYVSCDTNVTWLGDQLCINTVFDPANTCGNIDQMNYRTEDYYCREVVGSYDPNEKIVVKPTDTFVSAQDEFTYQINFQNTGTDTAINVIVKDQLSEFLDPESVFSGASSHPYTFSISGKGILEWKFDNIMLPDSNVNEASSHGFVVFKVRQKPGNTYGTIIHNEAGIYFDFNPPVLTNFTTNIINTFTTVRELPELGIRKDIQVYPNPSSGTWDIRLLNSKSGIVRVRLFSMNGVLARSVFPAGSARARIGCSSCSSGVYLLEVLTSDGNMLTRKLMIR